TVALAFAARNDSLPFRARVAVLLVALYSATTSGLMLGGLSPNILVAMCAAVVMGTLLLGRWGGLALVLLASATVMVVVPLRNAGLVPQDLHITYERPDLPTLWRVAFAFALLSTIIVVTVAYLLERAERLLAQRAQALERLRREEEERRKESERRKRTEAAFQKARELEVLGRLASSVAHDFNNALLIIQANADLARLRPSYVDTALRDIGAAIQQAAATTRQLRAFTPQSRRPPHPLSLADTLGKEVDLLRRILPANITLRWELAPSSSALPAAGTEAAASSYVVLADDGQVQSVLTNLALNARDAMPEGGTLDVRLRMADAGELAELAKAGLTGRFATIEVEDTGVGMPPETAARVFEPFFTTKGASGTGLGLSSVRTAVEEGGGRVKVTSQEGKGSSFTLFWPLHDAAPSAPVESAGQEPPASGTVLVVDDDDDVRAAMVRPLSWRGFTVLEARSGADALMVARRHHDPIDVLCVDLVMPGMPARQLVESFRQAHPAARVLLCSGYLPDDEGKPLDVADAFLSKPFSPAALAKAVRGLVAVNGTDGAAKAKETDGASQDLR
ncbi:MAG TPA: ATP-binding protein, partial [Polyangiaceae bacterium]